MTTTLRKLFILLFCVAGMSSFAQVQVISPNGGETWLDGSPAFVSFNNSGTDDYFIIQFSADNGNTWTELEWTYGYQGLNEIFIYPYLESTTQAKVRVANYYNPSVYDDSDATFTVIIPAYYIDYPMLGDSYYQGQEIPVQWYTNNANAVNVEFSSDNGASWTEVGSGITTYFYSFTAPQVVSDQCLVRLSDATDATINTVSSTFSIITAPTITLVSPNGGEVWNYGEYYTVTWTGTNLEDYVIIEISPDGGNTWQQLAWGYSEQSGGSAEVSAPMIPTTNARIRVSASNVSSVSDISDADFTVISPAYMVVEPYAGTPYYTDAQIQVQWYTSLLDNVDIQISVDNGVTFETVLSDVPAYTQFVAVDAPDQPTENCKIKVVAADNPSLFDVSESFRIVALPELTLTFPAGGEILDNDSLYQISWNLSGELLYYYYGMIDLSLDNGATWQNIGWTYDLQSQNTYAWRTPSQLSDQCLIRITDYYNDSFSAISSSPFSIKDFPTLDICMVSVDSVSGKNVIVWNKVESDLISEYVVLKETNVANEYVEVGSVNPTATSVITDQNSNPSEKATRYKLTFRDSQGNLYNTSALHQTIHLSINKGVGETWNLYWNQYLGFEVSSYNIYRGNSPNDLQLIGTVSGNFTSYTDQNAQSGFVYYMVEVVNPNQCTPDANRSSFYGSSKSNIATNNSLGIGEKDEFTSLTAYPNPASDMIRISSRDNMKGVVKLTVVSSFGQVVGNYNLYGSTINNGFDLGISELSTGIYTLIVSDEQKSSTIRFIKQQ